MISHCKAILFHCKPHISITLIDKLINIEPPFFLRILQNTWAPQKKQLINTHWTVFSEHPMDRWEEEQATCKGGHQAKNKNKKKPSNLHRCETPYWIARLKFILKKKTLADPLGRHHDKSKWPIWVKACFAAGKVFLGRVRVKLLRKCLFFKITSKFEVVLHLWIKAWLAVFLGKVVQKICKIFSTLARAFRVCSTRRRSNFYVMRTKAAKK